MSKIRVMAIAPYNGLRELINEISKKYSDQLEITSVVGDLYQGLQIAKTAEKEGYDIIISRGGTSEMIMKEVSIPIINIDVSGYDYMRSIKIAENIPGLRAVIGFSYIIKGARSVNDLLQTDIHMFKVQSQDEIDPLLRRLKSEGYGLIIGDVATVSRARDMNMNSMLLTSGEESVNTAFLNAIKICGEIDRYRKKSNMFQMVVENSIQHLAVFSAQKELLYTNFSFDELGVTNDDFLKYFDNIVLVNRQDIMLQKGLKWISLCGKSLSIDERQRIIVYYVNCYTATTKEHVRGISFQNTQGTPGKLSDLFPINDIYSAKTIEIAEALCRCTLPVLITGAEGVGKSRMAYGIHRCSKGGQKPYVAVNCLVARPEGWEELIVASEKSVPLENGATICFENIHKMPYNWQCKLVKFLEEPETSNRYRFMATSTAETAKLVDEGKFCNKLYSFFSNLLLNLPEISQQTVNIKNPVNMFIIEFNSKFGKQVIGINDEGMKLLESFPWKNNFKELKQVVAQLVLTSKKPYIGEEEVKNILETRGGKIARSSGVLELDGTLDEIEIRVMQSVLELENGNLTNTAKRLGIGRSTLWRKLNKS